MANSLNDGLSKPDQLDDAAIDAAEIGVASLSGNMFASGGLSNAAFTTYANLTFIAGTHSGATAYLTNAVASTDISGAAGRFTNVVASTSLSGASAYVTNIVASTALSGTNMFASNFVAGIDVSGTNVKTTTLSVNNITAIGSVVLTGNLSGAGTLQLGGNAVLAGSAVLNGRTASAGAVGGTPRWGAAFQAGSDATGAGSTVWVLYPTAFAGQAFPVVTARTTGSGIRVADIGNAGSFQVNSQIASESFVWNAVGDR